MVIIVDENNFENEVLKSDKKVLVDFNAEWCGPCKMLAPVLDEMSESNNSVKFVSINVDENQDLASKYNVMSIPCLVLIENGEEIKRSIGVIPKSEIERFIGE